LLSATLQLRSPASKPGPLFSTTFPRRSFIFKVTRVSSFPAMATSCRRMRYWPRLAPNRTPLKFSRQSAVTRRQSAVARSKKATHNR
jgi:hypothetical protein